MDRGGAVHLQLHELLAAAETSAEIESALDAAAAARELGLGDAPEQRLEALAVEPARRLETYVPAMADKGRLRSGADADITVNAVCPGIVGTAMWLDHLLPSNFAGADEKKQNFEELMAKRIPLGRPQTTEDIADAVLYLATARNVTGIALTVAGGIQVN